MPLDLTNEEVKSEAIEGLKGLGMVIRTQEEDETFVSSKLTDAKTSFQAPIVSKIKELTGYEGSESDPDKVVSNAFTSLKTGLENSVDEWKNKFTELDSKVKEGADVDSLYKGQYDTLKDSSGKTIQELTDQVSTLKNEMSASSWNIAVNNAYMKHQQKLPDAKDNKHIHELAQARVDTFKRKFTHATIDGVQVVKDENGEVQKSSQDGSILSVDQVTESLIKDLFDQKRVVQGAGSGSGGENEPGQIGSLPDSVKGKVSLAKWIAQSTGLKSDSHEFAQLFVKYVTENPNLPIAL